MALTVYEQIPSSGDYPTQRALFRWVLRRMKDMKYVWILLLAVVAILTVLLFFVCGFIFNQLVWRKTIAVPKWISNRIAGNTMPDTYEKKNKAAIEACRRLPTEAVELHAPDGARLCGKLLTPATSNGRLLIACHGARSNGTGEFALMLPYLYKKGYTVLLPDHRGCGESDGNYMGYGTHESQDTLLWLDYAAAHFPQLSVFLLGVSMGGATVLMLSDKVDPQQVKGILADCAYTSAWEEFAYHLHHSFHLPSFPILHICDLYCRLFAGYSFRQAAPIQAVAKAKVPILFIHGKQDDFVPFFMRDRLYAACPTDKFKLTVPKAVHARSYYTDSTAYQLAMERFTNYCLRATK